MMEALRPSIEEAQPINTQELALDYIGKRSNQVGVGVVVVGGGVARVGWVSQIGAALRLLHCNQQQLY